MLCSFLDAPLLKGGASYLVTLVSVCNFFHEKKFFPRISQIPKQEHVSAHSEQLFIFWPIITDLPNYTQIQGARHNAN